LQTE